MKITVQMDDGTEYEFANLSKIATLAGKDEDGKLVMVANVRENTKIPRESRVAFNLLNIQ